MIVILRETCPFNTTVSVKSKWKGTILLCWIAQDKVGERIPCILGRKRELAFLSLSVIEAVSLHPHLGPESHLVPPAGVADRIGILPGTDPIRFWKVAGAGTIKCRIAGHRDVRKAGSYLGRLVSGDSCLGEEVRSGQDGAEQKIITII